MDVIDQDVKSIIGEDLPWDKFQNSTILITGATGMIGRYLVHVLLTLADIKNINTKVIALARNKDKAEKIFGESMDNLQILVGDVASPIEIEEKIDYIIHAASPASPQYFKKDPVGVISANTLGTFNTAELAKKNNAQYCFISTMEVYGQIESSSEKPVAVKEEDYGLVDILDLRSAYPQSKRLAENLCVAYGVQFKLDYKIARLTHTYGPGMDIKDNRVQAEFMRQALAGQDIVLKSDGSMMRTYTYIADTISGMFHILLKDEKQKVYNVANESAKISIKELAETISNHSDKEVNIKFETTDRAKEMWSKFKGIYADSTKLKKLGWTPRISPDEGVNRSMRFYKTK